MNGFSKHENNTEDIIKYYFNKGTQYKKIVQFLKGYHDIEISVRTLKRWLSEMGLKRKVKPPIDDSVCHIIKSEIRNTSEIKGYRSIWQKLRVSYGIAANRDEVVKIVKDINPEQSQNRRARKLHRRIYTSPGPNAV